MRKERHTPSNFFYGRDCLDVEIHQCNLLIQLSQAISTVLAVRNGITGKKHIYFHDLSMNENGDQLELIQTGLIFWNLFFL